MNSCLLLPTSLICGHNQRPQSVDRQRPFNQSVLWERKSATTLYFLLEEKPRTTAVSEEQTEGSRYAIIGFCCQRESGLQWDVRHPIALVQRHYLVFCGSPSIGKGRTRIRKAGNCQKNYVFWRRVTIEIEISYLVKQLLQRLWESSNLIYDTTTTMLILSPSKALHQQ